MIPDDWSICTLNDITQWSSGGTPSKQNQDFWHGDIPWISAASMKGNEYSSSIYYINKEGLNSGSKLAPKNSILLLVRGSMLWNKIPIGIANVDLAFNQDVKCIQTKPNLLPKYLLYWLLSIENTLLHMVVGTGIGAGKLDTEQLKSLPISFPPLAEQKKIAQILSTWDKAITTNEKLLANSEQQKKALMQQLLTGKQRFSKSNAHWKDGYLCDIAKISKGKALSGKDLVNGIYPVIAGGKASPYNHNKYTHENAITISASGAYAGYVSYHPYKIWASDCSVVTAKNDSILIFIYQLLTFLQEKIYSLQSGGAQPHIYPKDIGALKIKIPSFQEQQEISSVLSIADWEIKNIKQKLNCLKQEKKALMQQLLTGKKRVRVTEINNA